MSPINLCKAVTLGCILSLTVTSIAPAYEFIGSSWSLSVGESVPYQVNLTLSADIDDGPCLAAIRAGFASWSEVSCSYMAWREDGRTQATGWGVADNQNIVSWREDSWDDSAATLAITSNIFDFRGFIDTDIKYNGYHHTWALIGTGDARGTDVESVTAHEVGHALGLDHSDILGATMWPSTGPNDPNPRSLSQDDIDGICALYPSGGEVPTPINDPPPTQMGTAVFGEDCSAEQCISPLFCVNDGVTQFCSQRCDPRETCPEGYYCAQLSSGSGACAPGEPPVIERAGFNETCGGMIPCEAGLLCLRDRSESYCSSPCERGLCPEGFDCAGLQAGGDICARESPVPPPEFGEPCERETGRCASPLFCLSDPLYVSAVSGEVIPYCSRPCEMGCPTGFRCTSLGNGEDACQRVPTAGVRQVGDPCWLNPERPFDEPTCGDELRCVGTRRDMITQEIIELGQCTMTCTAERCCPVGWGCASVTPFLALCAADVVDDEGFICIGDRPSLEDPTRLDGEGGAEAPEGEADLGSVSLGKDEGCAASSQKLRSHWLSFCILMVFMLAYRSARKHRSVVEGSNRESSI